MAMITANSQKRNAILFSLVLVAILGTALATFIFSNRKSLVCKPGQSSDLNKAICQAVILYNQQKQLGTDFSEGPCLSNDLFPGWVADIVHNPRQSIDNLPANQCQAFIEGRANHFVELDTEGNIVRAE